MKHTYTYERRVKIFWSRVNKTVTCWEWTAGLSSGGYGLMFNGNITTGAHRFSWELHNGEIPNGLFVLHECDNTKCVNPKHLFLGTQLDNIEDRYKKQRTNKKLSDDEITEIRNAHIKFGFTRKELSLMYEIHYGHVVSIINKRRRMRNV